MDSNRVAWFALAIATLSLLSTAYVGTTRDDREVALGISILAQRVSALEAHQVDSAARLERIERAVVATDIKVDQLVKLMFVPKQK